MKNIKNGIVLLVVILLIILGYINFFNYKQIDHFNKNECLDTNICITLGMNKNDIIKYFDNFKNFDLVKESIKKIGSVSYNGFVFKIEYIKDNYKAFSILKSNIGTSDADNLIYEYIVGLFINKQLLFFPCFIETYGLYSYISKDRWDIFRDNVELDGKILSNSLYLIKNKDVINKGCVKYLAILLQYIDNAVLLKDKIKEIDFINYELFNILFQIYLPLTTLSGVFTHNDLNCNNILLYKPYNLKYIKYHYYLNSGEIIIFKSQYIAKIIDYGNTYFIDDLYNTENIYEHICMTGGCEDDCYKYSVNTDYKRHIIVNFLINEIIVDILNNTEIINKKKIELLQKVENENINIIFENILNSFITNSDNNKANDLFFNKYTKSGDLYIFQDGRKMQYIENYK